MRQGVYAHTFSILEEKLGGLTNGGGLTSVGGLTNGGGLPGLANGGGLSGLTQPLGGVGLKRDILGGAKLLNFGRPGKTTPGFNTYQPNANVCSAGNRYVSEVALEDIGANFELCFSQW